MFKKENIVDVIEEEPKGYWMAVVCSDSWRGERSFNKKCHCVKICDDEYIFKTGEHGDILAIIPKSNIFEILWVEEE